MNKKICLRLLLILILLTGFTYCLAQEKNEEGGVITLYIEDIKTIPVDTPTRVAVGNPSVADIISVSKKKIEIIANGEGTTNLIWWDKLGQQSVRIRVYSENINEIKSNIDNLLRPLNLAVYTQAIEGIDKVLLLGEVKDTKDLERINTALGELKKKVANLIQIKEEEASVEIDAEVLEISKDLTKELGFTSPPGSTEVVLTEPTGKYGDKLTDIPEALFHVGKWTRTALNARLQFFIEEGKAQLLSRPRLVCQSGKEAELMVGGEKPIMTTRVGAEGGEGTEIEYKEYGIKLKIKPRVMSEERIHVSLNVDVSDIGTAETLGTTTTTGITTTTTVTARAYPTFKRTTSTELLLNNGQTLAISGLIRQKSEEVLRKFPWLGDIPILGMFFRGKVAKTGGGGGERGDTELVILLTPSILPKKETIPQEASKVKESAVSAPTQTPAPAVAPTPVEAPAEALTKYIQAVAQRIRDNLNYPWAASQAKLEGSVKLALHLSSTGQLLDLKVRKSSGFSILDENAIGIAKQISPYPPFPPQITEEDLWIEIPLVYNLK